MFINLLILSITAIMLGFVVWWLLSASLRSSIEKPKYGVAQWDRDRPDCA